MSMVDPSIDYLAEKVDSKYTLVILAALREIADDVITYERKVR